MTEIIDASDRCSGNPWDVHREPMPTTDIVTILTRPSEENISSKKHIRHGHLSTQVQQPLSFQAAVSDKPDPCFLGLNFRK